MTNHDIAILASLTLTVSGISLAYPVLKRISYTSWKALRHKKKTPEDWLLMSLSVLLIGGGLDQAYWFFPWLFEFLRFPEAAALFKNGVYTNIVFRQGAFILYCYCHIICLSGYVNERRIGVIDIKGTFINAFIFSWVAFFILALVKMRIG